MLSKSEMKAVSGGGTCGVNYYGTNGDLQTRDRNVSKVEAQDIAAEWNSNHAAADCAPECNAVAKWCCQSC